MNSVVLTKTYAAPIICRGEILRYAGCKEPNREILTLLEECIGEAADKLTYKVCYREFDVKVCEDVCDIGAFKFYSKDLAKNLADSEKIVLFAATVGVGIDRLIARYGRISPAKALMFQAIGAERIEALCDAFCTDLKQEYNSVLKPRFSSGYGDLSLETQKDIFAVLDCEKRIGLTLTDTSLMCPSKSVTAIVGICGEK